MMERHLSGRASSSGSATGSHQQGRSQEVGVSVREESPGSRGSGTQQEPRDTPHPNKAGRQVVELGRRVAGLEREVGSLEGELRRQKGEAGELRESGRRQREKIEELEKQIKEEKEKRREAQDRRDVALRETNRARKEKEAGERREKERADRWKQNYERRGQEVVSMSNERSIGRQQLADMEAEVTRLTGLLTRNESERVNRRQEWEELVAQGEENARRAEQQILQMRALAGKAGTERGETWTRLMKALDEIKKLKERLEQGPAILTSGSQGGRDPLGETETTAEPERERTPERVEDLTGSPEVDYGGSTDEGEKEDEGKEYPQGERGGKDPEQSGEADHLAGSGSPPPLIESDATDEFQEEAHSEVRGNAQETSSSSMETSQEGAEPAGGAEEQVQEFPHQGKEGDPERTEPEVQGTATLPEEGKQSETKEAEAPAGQTNRKKRAPAGKGKGKKQGKK